jgi:hypothetical protein
MEHAVQMTTTQATKSAYKIKIPLPRRQQTNSSWLPYQRRFAVVPVSKDRSLAQSLKKNMRWMWDEISLVLIRML